MEYLWRGISWGCTFFVFTCLVSALMGNALFLTAVMSNFPKQALCAMLTGIACASSAVVYTFEKLPRVLQVSLHFAIGLGGYFLVALWAQWIPLEAGTGPVLLFAAIGVFTFAGIWLGFYLHNRREAKKLNAKLKELDK